MRKLIIVSIAAMACTLAFSSFLRVTTGPAVFAQAGAGNRVIDRNGALPSIPPPPGWKACPRCQNQRDRAESNAKDQAEQHRFDPHDLTGIWGFNGLGRPGTPPPMTEWGK